MVDREGLAGLSTRRIAAELGVQSPAIYWHVKDKKELLGLMIERVLEGSISIAPMGAVWWEWLYDVGREQHRMLLSHRDGGVIASSSIPSERMRNEVFELAVSRLVSAGFSRQDAAAAWGGLASLVLGAVIYQQNQSTLEFAATYGDPQYAFEVALRAYVIGIKQSASTSIVLDVGQGSGATAPTSPQGVS